MRTAQIAVDVQKTFMSGGELGIEGSEAIVPHLLAIADKVDFTIATRDKHPHDHISFQGSPHRTPEISAAEGFDGWPGHGREATAEVDVQEDLNRIADLIVSKGTSSLSDAYSGFEGTVLASVCEQLQITTVVVSGLATDYCVRATALDAARLGLRVIVPLEAMMGVEVQAGDCDRAIAEMRAAGCEVIPIAELDQALGLGAPAPALGTSSGLDF